MLHGAFTDPSGIDQSSHGRLSLLPVHPGVRSASVCSDDWSLCQCPVCSKGQILIIRIDFVALFTLKRDKQ